MSRLARRSLSTLLCIIPIALAAQRPFRPDTARLQRLLVAEDARGMGVDGLSPLVEGLASPDTMLRRVAVRAAGRLQRPVLGRMLAAALADPVAAVRAEAANAIAQSENGVRRVAGDSGQGEVRWAAGALGTALAAEKNPAVIDALAESLGRLPFGDTTTARAAQRAIVAGGGAGFGKVHGLYWLAVNRTTTGGLLPEAVAMLRGAARPPSAPVARRVALLALTAGGALDSVVTLAGATDGDEQVRRLALAGSRTLSPTARGALLKQALADPSVIVRVAAIGMARAGNPRPDCAPIIPALNDRHPYVVLTAIDALAMPCADSADVAVVLAEVVAGAPARSGIGTPQFQDHALLALAHVDPLRAAPSVAAHAASGQWLRRMYAARAASFVHDTGVLLRLAGDADHNVCEAAITGLSVLVKHNADSTYILALASRGYQVVLAAAAALNGSRDPAALPALLDAFDRLSNERRENAKDPRVAVLKRISEMGSAASAPRLQRYLADFDTTIAATVAIALSRWTATQVAARPLPLPTPETPLARVFLAKDVRLKVTMAAADGGGTFTIRLFTDEAPATNARIIHLVRDVYRIRGNFYDGHLFQRVEPNFVVQGGGPDASEYVGDAEFMRDELAWHSHFRGTLGVSSRGRDTGDAQWFFNLADNTRLDHEYTVFGEVISGLDVVERILEGDAIARVEVIGGP